MAMLARLITEHVLAIPGDDGLHGPVVIRDRNLLIGKDLFVEAEGHWKRVSGVMCFVCLESLACLGKDLTLSCPW